MDHTNEHTQFQSTNKDETSCAHLGNSKRSTQDTGGVAGQRALLSGSAQTPREMSPNSATSKNATQAQTQKTNKWAARDVKKQSIPSTHDARQRSATASAHPRIGPLRRRRQTQQRSANAQRGVRAMEQKLDEKFLTKVVHANLPHTGTQQELSQTRRSQRKKTEKRKHDNNATTNSQTFQNAFMRDVLQPNLARRSSTHPRCGVQKSAFDFLRTAKRNRIMKCGAVSNTLHNLDGVPAAAADVE